MKTTSAAGSAVAEPATQGPFRAEGDQTSPTRPGAHPDGCTAAPPEILRRVPAAVAARRPVLPCPEGPASCRALAAVAPRSTLLRREYGAGCRHNPPGVLAGGARKDAAVGGAEGGRELGLRRAIGSARAHRAEELAVDKKACKEGGLTVEQGGAGPVVAPGGAVR